MDNLSRRDHGLQPWYDSESTSRRMDAPQAPSSPYVQELYYRQDSSKARQSFT